MRARRLAPPRGGWERCGHSWRRRSLEPAMARLGEGLGWLNPASRGPSRPTQLLPEPPVALVLGESEWYYPHSRERSNRDDPEPRMSVSRTERVGPRTENVGSRTDRGRAV